MNISEEVRDELKLLVDENNLLEEWQGQASMMLDYGIRLADARQEEDECRAALAVVVSELDRDIREDPEKYGLPKVTDSIINNAIPGQPKHKKAMSLLNKARHEVRVLQAVVDALDHRKRTLQGMTDLWLRQWYADPKSSAQPEDLRTAGGGCAPAKTIPGRRKRRAV